MDNLTEKFFDSAALVWASGTDSPVAWNAHLVAEGWDTEWAKLGTNGLERDASW